MSTKSFASGKQLFLAKKLTPAGVLTVTSNPGPTNGRLYFVNDNQTEWIDYTTVIADGDNFILGGLTRDLDPDDIPSTSNSTGKTWLATDSCVLVAMHDQLVDKQQDNTFNGDNTFEGATTVEEALVTEKGVASTIYTTTAARDSALGGDGVATLAYTGIQAGGTFYNYNTSTSQWESIDTGTVTPNATDSVAGKVELSTTAESKAGTDSGVTGASLSVLPSDIAANEQSNTFKYAADAEETDTYVITLTPTLTAYTTGMKITFRPNTTNTGACSLNPDALGARSIKLIDGTDPLNGDLTAGRDYTVLDDGTNFVLQQVPERATDADITAGTDILGYVTPKQFADNSSKSNLVVQTITFDDDAVSDIVIAHGLGKIPKAIIIQAPFEELENMHHGQATYDGSTITQKCYKLDAVPAIENLLFTFTSGAGSSLEYSQWTISSINTTNVTLTHAYSGTWTTLTTKDYFITFIG